MGRRKPAADLPKTFTLDLMTTLDSLSRILQQVDQFRQLSLPELKSLLASGKIEQHPPETVLFHEDHPAAGLFLLVSGQVQLQKISMDGKISTLAVITPITLFNEVSALDGGINPATAVTSTASVVWRILPEQLQAAVLQHPPLGLWILHEMAKRNRHLVARFQDLSSRSVLARCAKLLYELSQQGQAPIDRRKNPNHQMASQIATVPEAFSRALRKLKEQGIIQVTEPVIRVVDVVKLAEIAQLVG